MALVDLTGRSLRTYSSSVTYIRNLLSLPCLVLTLEQHHGEMYHTCGSVCDGRPKSFLLH